MKSKLRSFLINTCVWVFSLSTVFFIFIFIIFLITGVPQPFKETLSISVSFLSAVATLGAAIIAARLFQTWKAQHNYVEQIQILSQMVETMDSILFTMVDARINENLENIILGHPYKPPLSESFTEQKKNVKILENLVCKLFYLENQIYLLRNDKKDCPVFTKNDKGGCSLSTLRNIIGGIHGDICTVQEYLASDMKHGDCSFTKLDLNDQEVRQMILLILREGDSILRMVIPERFKLKNNPINLAINKCIKDMNQKIMDYRDT
ncbi:hypothetical protein NRB13_15210, partial [Acinetobacter baumannii]|nr:hypothetical protein [Acinetobacter baumannii]